MHVPRGRPGFSLLELMASLVILSIVIVGMAQFLYEGRGAFDEEEWKRTATEVGSRLLEERRALAYPATFAADTTITIDGKAYRTVISAQVGTPQAYVTRVSAVTSWSTRRGVTRTISLATLMSNHP